MAARMKVTNARMHQCTNAPRWCVLALVHWCIGAFLLASPLKAQPPDVDAMLEKAADYVDAYKRDFVGLVAEESYRQEVIGRRTRTDFRGFPIEAPRQRRDLKSDILYVRMPDADRWLQFRERMFSVMVTTTKPTGSLVDLPYEASVVRESKAAKEAAQ